jgi:hypothetical protein
VAPRTGKYANGGLLFGEVFYILLDDDLDVIQSSVNVILVERVLALWLAPWLDHRLTASPALLKLPAADVMVPNEPARWVCVEPNGLNGV